MANEKDYDYNGDGYFAGSDDAVDDYSDYDQSIPKHTGDAELHFTPRDPSRKKAREAALQKKRSSYAGRSESEGGKKKSAVRQVRSVSRKKAQRTSRRAKSLAGGKSLPEGTAVPMNDLSGIARMMKEHSAMVTAGICLLLAVIVGVTMAIKAVYTSKTIFSQNGKALDANIIQERLITESQNRDKVTYFLVVGVDKSSMLTDCLWVMCFDNQAHKIDVMQIPRDTYVGSDSLFPHKINAVYANPQTADWCEQCDRAVSSEEIDHGMHTACGKKITSRSESNINAIIRCINNRLSLPIDHYVLFDFDGFEKVIDAMGGVDIYLDEETKVYPNKYHYDVLPAGDNHLGGHMALNFMRNRQIYIEGDLGRVRAQRKIIHAMMEKMSDMTSLDLLAVLLAAYGNINTDMSMEEMRGFIAPLKQCSSETLHMFEMPGTDHWVKPNPSYYICNESQTVEAINEYMLPYSEKLTEDDIHFPVPRD